jgi:hypothetical protein
VREVFSSSRFYSSQAEEGQDEMPCTPESREMLKQHTLRRARMNNQLTELNKILETKEKLANKFIQNDTKMVEMQAKYEVFFLLALF